MGRKRFRIVEGAPQALAAVCVDCGADKIHARDRCARAARRTLKPEEAAPAPVEFVSKAREVARYLRAL